MLLLEEYIYVYFIDPTGRRFEETIWNRILRENPITDEAKNISICYMASETEIRQRRDHEGYRFLVELGKQLIS